MTTDLACLQSLDAFLAAPSEEVAAAVLVCGFGPTFDPDDRHGRIDIDDLTRAIVDELGLIDEKPGSMKYFKALASPPASLVAEVVEEGVLLAEQRLCMVRNFVEPHICYVRLLRRGRHSLATGNPFLYLRPS
jgi:hypothetical protein